MIEGKRHGTCVGNGAVGGAWRVAREKTDVVAAEEVTAWSVAEAGTVVEGGPFATVGTVDTVVVELTSTLGVSSRPFGTASTGDIGY